jgi:KDO2-lipid IV(A) lauroyltransferase
VSGAISPGGPEAALAVGSFREELPYHLYRGVAAVSRALPERPGRAAFDLLGRAGHAALPGLRATVTANQAQVLGLPLDDALVRRSTHEAFRLYARYWFDTFRLPQTSDEEIVDLVDARGFEHIEESLALGKGVLNVLPHLGNWDVGGRFMSAKGYRVTSVAEALKPARLFDLFLEHRRALGMEILSLSSESLGRQIGSRLADNRIVALVADRDLGGRGVEVEMFGRARLLPAGPAFLSITTGAPIMVTPVYTLRRGWRIVFGAPLAFEPGGERKRDVVALTKMLAAEFERAIAAAPWDWHMFQPGWEP